MRKKKQETYGGIHLFAGQIGINFFCHLGEKKKKNQIIRLADSKLTPLPLRLEKVGDALSRPGCLGRISIINAHRILPWSGKAVKALLCASCIRLDQPFCAKSVEHEPKGEADGLTGGRGAVEYHRDCDMPSGHRSNDGTEGEERNGGPTPITAHFAHYNATSTCLPQLRLGAAMACYGPAVHRRYFTQAMGLARYSPASRRSMYTSKRTKHKYSASKNKKNVR